MSPKKSLGQHWLHDRASLDAVCEAGLVHEHDTVLEVGPGLGTLTEVILSKGAQVVAIEKDEKLADDLSKKFDTPRLKILTGDILDLDLTQMPASHKVVANIPYYLTSNLLRTLSESKNPPKIIAILVQKEVAERIAAKPGEMSILSVSTQVYYEPHLEKVVPARLFAPPPKVDSQIVQLLRRPEPLINEDETKKFFRVVKAGFSARRKTLENSLAGGLQMGKGAVREVLESVKINPSARPQDLSVGQWIDLAGAIEQTTSLP